MNKHSEPLFQKSNFSPLGMINFSNIFITSPETFQFVIRSRGERTTDFFRFVTILPIWLLSDRTNSINFHLNKFSFFYKIAGRRGDIKWESILEFATSSDEQLLLGFKLAPKIRFCEVTKSFYHWPILA